MPLAISYQRKYVLFLFQNILHYLLWVQCFVLRVQISIYFRSSIALLCFVVIMEKLPPLYTSLSDTESGLSDSLLPSPATGLRKTSTSITSKARNEYLICSCVLNAILILLLAFPVIRQHTLESTTGFYSKTLILPFQSHKPLPVTSSFRLLKPSKLRSNTSSSRSTPVSSPMDSESIKPYTRAHPQLRKKPIGALST